MSSERRYNSTMWHNPPTPLHNRPYRVHRCRVWMHILKHHELPEVMSLFVLLFQSTWNAVKWTKKCNVNKRSFGVRRDCDEKSVASETKLLTPHFLSFLVLRLPLSQNTSYMCGPYFFFVSGAFHPGSTVETQHVGSRKSAPCEPFVLRR